jgi:hypothetical protein
VSKTSRFIIVTGGDAHYYPMIVELLTSIRRFPEGQNCAIGVIDAGLLPEQRRALEECGCDVRTPEWEYALSPLRKRGREYLRANIAKLCLPKYFSEHEIILWIDGDAWIQDWAAVALYISAAERGKFAIVPQSGRHRPNELMVRWLFGGIARVRSILYKNGSRAGLPKSVLRKIALQATLNAGAFSLRADAPHWAAFQKWQEIVIQKGRIFTSDQLAMALAVYADGLSVELLPDWCNYIGPWRINSQTNEVVEYYMPNRPAGIVHMASFDEMRKSLDYRADIFDLDDQLHSVSLRYPFWTDRAPGQ